MANGKSTQEVVNNIFSQFHATEPFMEFNEESSKKLSEVLLELDAVYTKTKEQNNDIGKSLKAVTILVLDLITKEHVHPSLAKLGLGIHLTHNKDAQHLGVVPPPIKYHSDFTTLQDTPASNPITADTMKGVEILAYFREDYEFNDHHYHWHMVYPYSGHVEHGIFKRTIERQGELFLYMHSQMIARYNVELLCWGLDMTHAWGYDEILTFGYNPVPNMRDLWGARPPFRGWYEDHNPHLSADQIPGFPPRKEMIRWRDNIFNAISNGYFETTKTDGTTGKFELTPANAANWVGVVVEAEDPKLQQVAPGVYIDRDKYGNVHNLGHDKFGEIGYHWYTSDKNPFDVMVSNIGSPRDPCFWLWHRHIDDFRQAVVKKYTHNIDEYQPEGLMIDEVKITRRSDPRKHIYPIVDLEDKILYSFLGPAELHNDEANARINHDPYQWKLTISTTSACYEKEFIIRIFMAPTVLIQDQRSWIEMDKFNATFDSSSGKQTYLRYDTQSSVARKEGEELSPRCRCGWPQNMMLPVGTSEGMDFVAFAMLTKGQLDPSGATQSISFCGANDGEYPDQLGMGYPFDKTWDSRVKSTASIREIVADKPHIKLYDFKIKRYTKPYEGNLDHLPPSDITWEKDIKGFFTSEDRQCMIKETKKARPSPKQTPILDLADKESVMAWASDIYFEVFVGDMPADPVEQEKWKDGKRTADFKEWMEHGFK